MIRVGIVGVSGYSGKTLLRLLLRHRRVRVTYVSANNTTGKLEDIWPEFAGRADLECAQLDIDKAVRQCDLFFLAVPHTVSMGLAPRLLRAGKKVIDLSGDYRLREGRVYKKWYGQAHLDGKNLKKAVYGLPELYKEDIRRTNLVANPGCYATAAILSLAPLTATYSGIINSVVIDAKSGVSGAGRKAAVALNFCEVNENFKAYKPLRHQHVPEIELYLSRLSDHPVRVDFVPHLLPLQQGILATVYVRVNRRISLKELERIYQRFYKTDSFVRVLPLGRLPELRHVVGTNYCDIALTLSEDKQLLVITTVIDNLMKGAAGQAVQNMNIMESFQEEEGLS